MYTSINDIKTIQLDHTSRCNLGCPQCARMWDNGKSVNPIMPITDLTLDDYKIMLEPFERNEVGLFHCGNFGDVIASPTFDETYEYSVEHAKRVKIATNGSARKPEWWRDLAQKGEHKNLVIFAFDGLEDTNHIYRVGANWKKAIENAQAYIDAGGRAEWNFIEFEHNYHQIEQARQMAKDMGFARFSVKYTARFADQNIDKVETKKGNEVKSTDNNINKKDMDNIVQTYESFDEYVQKTPITCKFQQDKNIFIDMKMKLWPCCWMGAPEYFAHKNVQTQSYENFWKLYGKDFNDMRIHGWKVLEHDFFQTYLDRSWNSQDNTYKRIYTCGRTCGGKFEFSSGHGKNFNPEDLKDD